MAVTNDEQDRLEVQLSLGMDDDGSPLSDERRTQIQERLDWLKMGGDAIMQEGPVADEIQKLKEHFPEQAPPQDLQALVQAEIARAMGGIAQSAQAPQMTFEDVLKQIDPRDSESALTMLDWLVQNGRLTNIGTINGGGYIWHYAEPKGASKQGYTPGATKGGRMVDQAVEQAKASGAKPRNVGICDKCWSAVEKHDDGSVSLDGDPSATTCAQGGQHNFQK